MQLVFSTESLHKLLCVKNFHVTLTSFAYQLLLWRAPYLPPHAMPGQPEFRLILALFNPEMNFTLIQEPDVIFSNLSNGQNCVLLLHCYIMVLCYTLQLAGLPCCARLDAWYVALLFTAVFWACTAALD